MTLTTTMNTDQQNIDSAPLLTVILQPGSSLHPTFLLILDVVLGSLALLLALLLYLTSGNLHFVGLLAIELSLWATLKWFINEIKRTNNTATDTAPSSSEEKKDQ